MPNVYQGVVSSNPSRLYITSRGSSPGNIANVSVLNLTPGAGK